VLSTRSSWCPYDTGNVYASIDTAELFRPTTGTLYEVVDWAADIIKYTVHSCYRFLGTG
jgi:hypothetical protein